MLFAPGWGADREACSPLTRAALAATIVGMSNPSRFDSLSHFATFLQQLIEEGVDCTPAEAVERWNAFRPELDGIQLAIDAIDRGEGIPAEEAMRRLRELAAEGSSEPVA